MASLGLVKADIVKPLIDDLNSRGTNVTLLLAKSKLPLIMAERQHGLIPWSATLGFLQIAGRYTGDPLYSANCILRAGGDQPNRVASLSLIRAPTVFESICTFVENANAITTAATIKFIVSGNWLWVLRRPNDPAIADSWQAEQFVIACFVKAVSFCLGQDWQPQKLKIRLATLPDTIPYQWRDAEIETAYSHTAIGIKLVNIVSKTNFDNERTTPPGNSNQAELRESVVYNATSLRSAVLHYMTHETVRMTHIADAFGIDVRTFRRHLTVANLSYNELINETRCRRALALLNDTNISITELAQDLGYEYPENFTRAFRKRVGVSPRKYREMIGKDMVAG